MSATVVLPAAVAAMRAYVGWDVPVHDPPEYMRTDAAGPDLETPSYPHALNDTISSSVISALGLAAVPFDLMPVKNEVALYVLFSILLLDPSICCNCKMEPTCGVGSPDALRLIDCL